MRVSRPSWIALAAALAMAVLAMRLANSQGDAADDPRGVDAADLHTTPPIRVLLGSCAHETLRLRIDGPYLVRPGSDFWVVAQGDKLPQVEARCEGQGIRIGAQSFNSRRLQIEIVRSGSLWVNGHRYRGSLNLVARPDGLWAINVVDLDAYLASVLPGEMPANYPLAAQQAQLIAARTFALFQMKTYGEGQQYDVYDSARSQVYLGMEYEAKQGEGEGQRRLAVESPLSRRLVEQTRDIVLVYRGRIFCTYFSAVCGGHTASAQSVFGRGAPPLVGVPCAWCGDGHNFRWQAERPLADVERKLATLLASSGKSVGRLQEVHVHDPGGGLVPAVELRGHTASHSLPATDFRSYVLGGEIPSARFDARVEGDRLLLSGRGWGHGVGMCQAGAKGLAEAGRNCAEILAHYFPGTELAAVQ